MQTPLKTVTWMSRNVWSHARGWGCSDARTVVGGQPTRAGEAAAPPRGVVGWRRRQSADTVRISCLDASNPVTVAADPCYIPTAELATVDRPRQNLQPTVCVPEKERVDG